MAYPNSTVHDIPIEVQVEILSLLDGCPGSRGLRDLLAEFRGDVNACEAQAPMFGNEAA